MSVATRRVAQLVAALCVALLAGCGSGMSQSTSSDPCQLLRDSADSLQALQDVAGGDFGPERLAVAFALRSNMENAANAATGTSAEHYQAVATAITGLTTGGVPTFDEFSAFNRALEELGIEAQQCGIDAPWLPQKGS